MPVYHLSTRINANVPPSYLLYDLFIEWIKKGTDLFFH